MNKVKDKRSLKENKIVYNVWRTVCPYDPCEALLTRSGRQMKASSS